MLLLFHIHLDYMLLFYFPGSTSIVPCKQSHTLSSVIGRFCIVIIAAPSYPIVFSEHSLELVAACAGILIGLDIHIEVDI